MTKFIIFVMVLVTMALLVNWPLMWLFNYVFAPSLLVAVFGIAQMTYWKTFAFLLLLGLIIGSGQNGKEG